MIDSLKLIFTRLTALIYKEYIVMFMDKGTRKILVLPLLIQAVLFGYGATFNLENIPYVIYQDTQDRYATEIAQRIYNSNTFLLQKQCFSEQCFKETLDQGEALLGLYIANDFASTHNIFIATDARNTASANTALSYLQALISDYNLEKKQNYGIKNLLNIEYHYFYNNNNITRFGVLTGMILALSMIQVLMLSSLSVSREREEGTFDMMLMTPLTPVEILIGKAIPPTIISCLQSLALTLICLYWFEIPCYGNIFAVFTVIVLFSISSVGIGLTISALSSTSQQSIVCSFALILPCIILSGMLTPISAMPEYLQLSTLINPFYYGQEALHRIYLEGQTLCQTLHLLLPLICLGIVTLSISVMLFRSKLN